MARIIRASLVAIVLLLTACRLGTARKEAIFRYAVAAILNVATSGEPAVAEQRPAAAVPRVQPATEAPRDASPVETCSLSIPVRPIAIAPSALRPAETPSRTVDRRIVLARVRSEAIRSAADAESAACREAARIRVEEILREIRAAHVSIGPGGNACRFDIVAPQPVPSPSFDVETVETVETIRG